MLSIEYIEELIGRSLTHEEESRVIERQSTLQKLHKFIDDRDFESARKMLNDLNQVWSDLNPDLVYAENCIDWLEGAE